MLKKRLIFILLYKNGNFYLSRNFRLQKVGGVDWLLKNYNFEKIVTAIDELVILNLSGDIYDIDIFFSDISKITKNCFIPYVKNFQIFFFIFLSNIATFVPS